MNHDHNKSSMSQKIFKIGLSVESISTYLLCCGIVDSGETITTKHLFEIWTSSKETLEKALQDLEERQILRKIISDREENTIYKLTEEKTWKVN